MKQSFFRIKVYFLKLFYFLPYWLLISLLQLVVVNAFENSMSFYVFYPLVYVGLEAGVNGIRITVVWFVNIFLYYVLGFVLVEKKNLLKAKKYLECPYCEEMIAVYYQWGCDKCKNFQHRDHYVTEGCDTCGKFLNTFCCEHCEREFRL